MAPTAYRIKSKLLRGWHRGHGWLPQPTWRVTKAQDTGLSNFHQPCRFRPPSSPTGPVNTHLLFQPHLKHDFFPWLSYSFTPSTLWFQRADHSPPLPSHCIWRFYSGTRNVFHVHACPPLRQGLCLAHYLENSSKWFFFFLIINKKCFTAYPNYHSQTLECEIRSLSGFFTSTE